MNHVYIYISIANLILNFIGYYGTDGRKQVHSIHMTRMLGHYLTVQQPCNLYELCGD
jgi:hypothetical protein